MAAPLMDSPKQPHVGRPSQFEEYINEFEKDEGPAIKDEFMEPVIPVDLKHVKEGFLITVQLPEAVDSGHIKMNVEEGILTILLPKSEETQSHS
ncbi:Hsp20 family protein [Bdellovibrio reynosensis]|uniref:Hsp20/alpha crystallin family protein n=1 Tax=Bdellovibrio reynosensis TaxID=2835041 RepID=A0ABY4C8Y4_9BACT|nr:Hsp20/alpha crystallin family protein [Bdellovibrio reynosensis]UOF01448.1 Hsp20/alpha crystallin family protein [Bdellovibrio reynosensis]